jgi:hypothetical protein
MIREIYEALYVRHQDLFQEYARIPIDFITSAVVRRAKKIELLRALGYASIQGHPGIQTALDSVSVSELNEVLRSDTSEFLVVGANYFQPWRRRFSSTSPSLLPSCSSPILSSRIT